MIRRAALLILLAAPALADTREIAPDAILGPEDHAHLFAEICLGPDPAAALAASPHFAPFGETRYASPDGLASYELTPEACKLGLTPGAADYGPALETALGAHIVEIAPGAASETLVAGTAWTWEAEDGTHRAEYLVAEDAYIVTHTKP